jgi:hypothetical protein
MTRRPSSLIYLCAAVAALIAGIAPAAVAQTNALKLIKGTITDARSGKPIDGGKLNVYQGSSTETVSFSKINPRTGFYQLILNPNTDYRFEVVSPKFYTTNFTVKTAPGANYEESVKDFKVEPIPMGTVIYSGRVFEPGSATISDANALRGIVDILKKESAIGVTVTVIPELGPQKKATPAPKKPKKGKAEPVVMAPPPIPSPSASLGEQRATALKNYFKGQGISTTRLGWDVRPPVAGPTGRAKGPDNVVVKISSIQDENDG